jgi:hypothetical protein
MREAVEVESTGVCNKDELSLLVVRITYFPHNRSFPLFDSWMMMLILMVNVKK